MAFVGFGCGDGRQFGDELAGDGGADGEVAAGVCGGGHAEVGEDGFDFLLDDHGWLVASVEGAGGWWQTDGYPPPQGRFCAKSKKETGYALDLMCKLLILLVILVNY